MIKMMRNNKGMTLVELLIASFITVIALGALLSSIVAALYLIDLSRDEVVAYSDLRSMMELVRTTAYANTLSSFPDGVIDGPVINSYSTAIGGYRLEDEHITVTYADLNSDPLEINIGLSWQGRQGRNHSAFVSTFKAR